MNILFIDAFSGVSGDKMVSALLSLGIDFDFLKKELSSLKIDNEYHLELSKKNVMGIDSFYFKVKLENQEEHHSDHDLHNHSHIEGDHHHEEHNHGHDEHHHHQEEHSHRNLNDIKELIRNSKITENAKKISYGIFEIVAEAEAKVHGKAINEVHFHEVGAVDSIIDIVSTGILIDKLQIDEIYSSKIPLGNGLVKCQHGLFPVPAPATAEILTGIPVYKTDIDGELTTPTGAAIVKYLTRKFGNHDLISIDKIGYGAGSKDLPIPNVLRLELGKISTGETNSDFVVKLETNIDDSTPENIAFLVESLFEKNALDVFSTPIVMKKGRLATLLTVLCYEKDRVILESLIFSNSTTFGIRRCNMERSILNREFKTIEVEKIEIRVKLGFISGKIIQKSIEYEDLKKLSSKLNISYNEAMEKIMKKI